MVRREKGKGRRGTGEGEAEGREGGGRKEGKHDGPGW